MDRRREEAVTKICSGRLHGPAGSSAGPPSHGIRSVNRCHYLLVGLVCLAIACSPSARSDKSYDQIRMLVAGKTAAEVERLLGSPDSRETLLLGDERWIWWNYTFLAGEKYPPEVRGKVIHLEIIFEKPAQQPRYGSQSTWRVSQPYGVGFTVPEGK